MKSKVRLFTVGTLSVSTLLVNACGSTYINLHEKVSDTQYQINETKTLPRGTLVFAEEDVDNESVSMRKVQMVPTTGWIPAATLENCEGPNKTGICTISNP